MMMLYLNFLKEGIRGREGLNHLPMVKQLLSERVRIQTQAVRLYSHLLTTHSTGSFCFLEGIIVRTVINIILETG